MRIMLISGSYPPMKCGVGDYTYNLAKALGKSQGIQIAVLTDASAQPINDFVDINVFPVVRGWHFSDFFRILKIVRSWKPDIIHIQYPTQGYGKKLLPWLLPILLFSIKRHIVQTWHEYYLKGSWQKKFKLIPSAIDPGRKVVVVKPNYKSHLPFWYRWLTFHKRFQLIPNASTIPQFQLNETERTLIRKQFVSSEENLVAFFGFLAPYKGVDLLFKIANPLKDHLVIIGELHPTDPYHKTLLNLMRLKEWNTRVTMTGFLSSEEAGQILTAADAVVLPFRNGGGMWNTSIHAAAIQGTFILTTSLEQQGYCQSENIYYAKPDDIDDMRQALFNFIGHRNTLSNISQFPDWHSIAEEHIRLYRNLVNY